MTLESDLDGFCKRQRQKNVHIRRLILQHCLVNFTLQFSHLSFYNIIQVVSLAFATFVCTLGREQQYFRTISYPRPPGSRLPHGLGVGLPLSLSFFLRLPGSSIPHGVGVGSPPSPSLFWLTWKAWHTVLLRKHAIDPA